MLHNVAKRRYISWVKSIHFLGKDIKLRRKIFTVLLRQTFQSLIFCIKKTAICYKCWTLILPATSVSVSVGNKKRKPSQMVSWASVIDTEALNHAQTIFRVAKCRKENSDEKMKEWDKTRLMEDSVTDSNTDLQCRVCMPEYSRWCWPVSKTSNRIAAPTIFLSSGSAAKLLTQHPSHNFFSPQTCSAKIAGRRHKNTKTYSACISWQRDMKNIVIMFLCNNHTWIC